MESNSSDIPTLPAGVTWLIDGSARSTAAHQLVLHQLEADRGQVLWIDARDIASTYTFYPLAARTHQLSAIQIARAWTAYQHHTLVRHAVERASARTRLIVVPHVCSLYRDDDLDAHEADQLLGASLQTLSALATALSLPVLMTAPQQERSTLASTVDHELQCESTDYGYAFRGEDFQTTVYHERHWWQTTIPYWVELLGAVRSGEVDTWAAITAHTRLETFA